MGLRCALGYHDRQPVPGSLVERRVDYAEPDPRGPRFVVTERWQCSRCPVHGVRPVPAPTRA